MDYVFQDLVGFTCALHCMCMAGMFVSHTHWYDCYHLYNTIHAHQTFSLSCLCTCTLLDLLAYSFVTIALEPDVLCFWLFVQVTNTAYFTFVSLNKRYGSVNEVPALVTTNDAEKARFDDGELRYEERKNARKEGKVWELSVLVL